MPCREQKGKNEQRKKKRKRKRKKKKGAGNVFLLLLACCLSVFRAGKNGCCGDAPGSGLICQHFKNVTTPTS